MLAAGDRANKFVGIQMTQVLVTEIARLVNENKASDKDIGLLAEQSEKGDYYLRLFADDPKFWHSLSVTAIYAVCAVPLTDQ